jgi:hypothetical protein
MNHALKKRIARLERHHGRGDRRQFGNDPRDRPDWALVASVLWGLESSPELKDRAEVIEARWLYDAGEIDAASRSLQPILAETIE